MKQILVLESFPSPDMARALSPNGRAHWRVKDHYRQAAHAFVAVAARTQGLKAMPGRVVLWPRFIYPLKRARDDDNLATGVMKAVRDALVRGGWLERDDLSILRQMPVEVSVTKGRRAVELEFEQA